MKTKVDFYSKDSKGNHKYEFSSFVDLKGEKPLTRLIFTTALKIGVSVMDIKQNPRRNYVHFKKPLNTTKKGLSIFAQDNVISFYCKKSK